ncbi:MAG: hypothetical protein KME38_29020 [Spirirestis rafaelensis WJT71-NPBG6]|jgi:hypothetical protein|nr:hypothetical protein [Spirirestis rafaelensis WJT71-NPBG6]
MMVQRFLDGFEQYIDERADAVVAAQKVREQMGFVSDESKLILLKQQLYRKARADENTADLRRAIDCIQEGLDAQNREKNSFSSQLSGLVNSLILAAFLATGLSYAVTKNCGDYSSQLCRDARVIPDAIARYIK